MGQANDSLVFEHLRLIRGDLGEIKSDVRELQTHTGGRIKRVETRLELVSP